jgi:hypothetical protein
MIIIRSEISGNIYNITQENSRTLEETKENLWLIKENIEFQIDLIQETYNIVIEIEKLWRKWKIFQKFTWSFSIEFSRNSAIDF